ncbi:MAG: peptidoglycan editing factor PgeF [Rhodothermales bacterium]|nr:peptidoglycan editing factor PgeF [Rhodothermales bacterium]
MSAILIRPRLFQNVEPVRAGFTTRSGGVSTGAFASLNMGLSTGDDPEAVRLNRRRAAQLLGFSASDMAIPGQIHGSEVLHVTEPGLYAGFDGVVTASRGILLGISAADCAAVLLADAEAGVVGACHAGWRGALGGVVEKTVGAMNELGGAPRRILAWISPCISAEHFEVGEEVASQFDAEFVVRRSPWPRPHVDLAGFIRSRLIGAGLASDGIETSGRCTVAESDVFFSHRANRGHTGRMMGLVGLAT